MSHRLPAFGLAALSVVALVTGCAPQAEPTPTPTPRFTSQAQAYQAAEATYRAYVDASNGVDLARPSSFESVYKWETGDALDADKKNLTALHSSGATKTGAVVINSIVPDNADSLLASVTVKVCQDVSGVDLRDASGRSIVDPSRSIVQSLLVRLSHSPASSTGLLVARVGGGSAPC